MLSQTQTSMTIDVAKLSQSPELASMQKQAAAPPSLRVNLSQGAAERSTTLCMPAPSVLVKLSLSHTTPYTLQRGG